MNLRVGVLVATRNRPEEIRKLLSSLVSQQISQVVISASGSNIEYVIDEFKSRMELSYVHSESGQIKQKINGLRAFTKDLDWVIFSDDDLIYPPDFFLKFSETLTSADRQGLIGVGFKIGNASVLQERLGVRIFKRVFLLKGRNPGSVNRSGECVPYCYGELKISTEWLNGASAWKAEYAHTYSSIAPDTKYAAYEDAIFSYELSRAGNLMYFPNLQIQYQDPFSLTQFSSLSYQSYTLWKLYFVIKFELSLIQYIWSTLGLSIIFGFNPGTNEKVRQKLTTMKKTWKCIFLVLTSNSREASVNEIIRCQLPKA